MPRSWRAATLDALRREQKRSGDIERQELLTRELGRIVEETGAIGATPDQTLSRILQDLRDEGLLEFLTPGRYRLVPAGVGKDWARGEVEALVADYFAMLERELRGQSYSKTEHRRALAPVLNERSDGSIERKHQNVSAVLIEVGYPYVEGYKPLSNYQALLREVVLERVATDGAIAATVQTSVDATATVPSVDDILDRWEAPPEPVDPVDYKRVAERPPRVIPSANYLERESRNTSLGRAGEEFVLRYERARLIHAGRESLAERIEHTSASKGDGAGFDIRSFEVNGADRLIEVKTTAYGKQTPFFLSRKEVSVSRERANSYHLYRLFRFREGPRLYGLVGALEDRCLLTPTHYSARVR